MSLSAAIRHVMNRRQGLRLLGAGGLLCETGGHRRQITVLRCVCDVVVGHGVSLGVGGGWAALLATTTARRL